MAYTRLSSDSEIIALRSAGLNVYRLIIPAIIVSFFVTFITFGFHNFLAPYCNYQATITLEKALDREKPFYKQTNIIYPEYHKVIQPDGSKQTMLVRLFYAAEFDGETMKNVTILDRTQANASQIIAAKSAKWNISENIWDFYNGTIYVIAPDGSYSNIIRFEHQKVEISRTPLDLAQREPDYDEMNIIQAQEYLHIFKLSGDDQKLRKLKVRIQEKLALPFVCLVFGIIGSALGLRPRNSAKGTSFGICVVLIFAYYLFSFITSSLGIWGVLSPFASAWIPNLLGFIAGGFLIYQASK
jgi:lipopolysaccharide export system permease protein